jgi:thiamine pyrophosphokinase
MLVALVASGELAADDVRWLDRAAMVIAADGGASSLDRLGRRPDLLVGDLDSVEPAQVAGLERAGVPVQRHPADKDATDTELAVRAAIESGATEVVVLGALGGDRLDHELANLLLLVDPQLLTVPARIVLGPVTVRGLQAGSLALDGAVGDLVSLLPVGGDAVGITTTGLRWPLEAATLRIGRSRGISNEIVSVPASVALEGGRLLVVETAIQGAIDP